MCDLVSKYVAFFYCLDYNLCCSQILSKNYLYFDFNHSNFIILKNVYNNASTITF